jgi:AraC family transcriptional regulator
MSLEPLLGEGRVRAREDKAEPVHSLSWLQSRLVFDHRRWACADADVRWMSSHHLVVLTEQGKSAQTLVRVDGRVLYDGRDRPGALTFVPASVERRCSYRDADLVYSALWIDPALQEKLCAGSRCASAPMFVNGSDEVISSLLRSVRADIAAGCVPDATYMEHAAALILLRLEALRGALPRAIRGARLNRKALSRVDDYVEAHLGSDITLSDLAAILRLPCDTFARQFKAATGQAPYAYVIERRIRRAESLLADGNEGSARLRSRLASPAKAISLRRSGA